MTSEQLQKDIQEIKKRNKRVEADKAWETSKFRVGTIVVITYIIATIVMWQIDVPKPYLNSLIPTIGYFLSTLTIPALKRWWIQRNVS